MINVAQIRAARGLLKWTQVALAHRAAISAVTLNMIENETVRPREATLEAIRAALEAGGVRFVEENGVGIGVQFSSNARPGDNDVGITSPRRRGANKR
jgi:transcriptional regulator with XRE-family HTH domain